MSELVVHRPDADFVETFGGRQFFYDVIDPNMFSVRDMAHSLSMLCRYAGHCVNFYCVGEHELLMARYILDNYQRLGLTYAQALRRAADALGHDNGEPYMVDMPRPLKHMDEMLAYREMEKSVERPLFAKYGLMYPMHPLIKELDLRICVDERHQNMSKSGNHWKIDDLEPLGLTLRFMQPVDVEREYLALWDELGLMVD